MTRILIAGLSSPLSRWLGNRLNNMTLSVAASAGETLRELADGDWSLLVLNDSFTKTSQDQILMKAQGGSTQARVPVLYCVQRPSNGASKLPVDETAVDRVLFHPLNFDELAREMAALTGSTLVKEEGRAAPAATSAEALAAIGAVWERRKGEIIGKTAFLEAEAASFLAGGVDPEARRTAEREAHKLAGSLGTFGFPEGSRIAKDIEQKLKGDDELAAADKEHLGELATSLVLTVREASEGRSPVHKQQESEDSPRLMVVSSDASLGERLGEDAAARGMELTIVRRADEARPALAARQPAAVLLDLENLGGTEVGLGLLGELSGWTPPVPVIVLTESEALTDRVEVAQRGGRGFLKKSIPSLQMIDAVVQLLKRSTAGEIGVLAVDDDPNILAALKALLEPLSVRISTVESPLEFWTKLEESAPDLVILDVDMPGISGTELCRVLRGDPRWTGLPVLFLTAHTDSKTVQQIFASGADDFISKPLVGPELVTRINNRLERIRLYRHMADTDPLTGTANRRRSNQALQQLVKLSDRYGQPFSFAIVDLDNFKRVNDAHGHGAGDDVLRRLGSHFLKAFRGDDVVARWGGEEFAVAMYGMSRENAVERLAELLESFRRERFAGRSSEDFGVTFSTGVAQYPEDGADPQGLYRAADDALYHAKESGRNRVLPSHWYSQIEQLGWADVALVEDDETLSALIIDALHTRGYRTRLISRMEEAADLLGATIPGLKVILLDSSFGAPSSKGLDLLRDIAKRRVLDRTRVIVLSDEDALAELARAQELGAYDHVTKPFSIPTLMRRVQKAIASYPSQEPLASVQLAQKTLTNAPNK